jgi:hypothetical protein
MQAVHERTEMPLSGWVLVALLIVAVAVAFNIGAGLIDIPGL